MRAADQFRQSDVMFWGIVALVCGAIAVVSANVSALIPDSALAVLHASRVDGANIVQLRGQLATLREETTRLRRDAAAMQTRFTLSEEAAGAVTRRVGALEVSLPKLLEALPAGAEIDRTNITAAIPAPGAVTTFEADGGTVAVTQQPMPLASAGTASLDQAMPAPVANPMAFGLALGPALPADQVQGEWDDLSAKVGPLLLGLGPLVADQADSTEKRLIAGPIESADRGQLLCNQLSQVGVACMLVPFTGNPL